MWVLKGVLLGFGIFLLGTLTCIVVAIGFAFYRLVQANKEWRRVVAGFGFDRRNIWVVIHHRTLWAALILSIVIGLLIIRARGWTGGQRLHRELRGHGKSPSAGLSLVERSLAVL